MAKRKPNTQLTHDNWDAEDHDEPEDAGVFQKASDEALKSRVIKQAKRRINSVVEAAGSGSNSASSISEPKSIFSSFTGFTNQQPIKKFSFSANLTDAVSSPSATTTAATKTNGSVGLSNKPFEFSFAKNETAATKTNCDTKSALKMVDNDEQRTSKSNPFLSPSPLPSALNAANADRKSSPSSMTMTTLTTTTTTTTATTTTTTRKLNELSAKLRKSASPAKCSDEKLQTADDVFVQKLHSLNLLCAEWIIKHLNENLSYILTPIFDDYQKYLNKLKDERQRASSTSNKKVKLENSSSFGCVASVPPKSDDEKPWTNASAAASPSPAFSQSNTSMTTTPTPTTTAAATTATAPPSSTSLFKTPDFRSSPSLKFNLLSNSPSQTRSNVAFPLSAPHSDGVPNFKFATNASSEPSDGKGDETTDKGKFSAGDAASSYGSGAFLKFSAQPKLGSGGGGAATPAVAPPAAQSTPSTATFSFGLNASVGGGLSSGTITPMVNPFLGLNNAMSSSSSSSSSLLSSASTPPTAGTNDEATADDDQPPPVVDNAITEEGSVYEKKCKVFVKKDGSFVDHGVGFLFLKLIGDEKKCQMIVRANNKLATIILNVLLSANVPVQLMGTNNVMVICCPTPDAKPSSVLLKVKTAKDADELLTKLKELQK